jgi:hypothetical protein
VAASISGLTCAAYSTTLPRKPLIFWPQQKIARCQSENETVTSQGFGKQQAKRSNNEND